MRRGIRRSEKSFDSWKTRTRSGSTLVRKRQRGDQVQPTVKRQKRTHKVGSVNRQSRGVKVIRGKTAEPEDVVKARKRRDSWLQASRKWAVTEGELDERIGITWRRREVGGNYKSCHK